MDNNIFCIIELSFILHCIYNTIHDLRNKNDIFSTKPILRINSYQHEHRPLNK